MTTDMLVIGGIIGLFVVVTGILVTLRIQHGLINRTQAQQNAWQRAQEKHQNQWEVKQDRRLLDLEAKLSGQVGHIRQEWQDWEEQGASQIQALANQYKDTTKQLSIEHQLARLPLVEETPVIIGPGGRRQHNLPNWQPPALQRANLSGLDLAHRYLGRADLREAILTNTSFFMADLSGASLAGADLSGADLSGADLSGADLRGVLMQGANLQVADLHNAVLIGANLSGAKYLTMDQLYSAIYDSSTQFDAEVDVTVPRIRSVRTEPKVETLQEHPSSDEALSSSPTALSQSTEEAPQELVSTNETLSPASTPLPAAEIEDEVTEGHLTSIQPETGNVSEDTELPVVAGATYVETTPLPEGYLEMELIPETPQPEEQSGVEPILFPVPHETPVALPSDDTSEEPVAEVTAMQKPKSIEIGVDELEKPLPGRRFGSKKRARAS